MIFFFSLGLRDNSLGLHNYLTAIENAKRGHSVIAKNRIKIFGWLCHRFKCNKFEILAKMFTH